MRSWFALFIVACSSAPPSAPSGPIDAAPLPQSGPDAQPPSPPPPYGPETTSLQLRRSIAVRFAPRTDAKIIGTIEADTRVAWVRAAPGDSGCPRWIEIAPRGWVCDKYLVPTSKPPAGEPRPRLEEGAVVPGVYGKVTAAGAKAYRGNRVTRTLAGAVTVRKMADVTMGGRSYWKTQSGELILAGQIVPDVPSRFAGVTVNGTLPLAWAQSRQQLPAKVAVRTKPDAKAPIADQLAPRTVVTPVDEQAGFMQIGDGRWIAKADLHVARAQQPPDDYEEGDRWLDVDTDEQVVVAYEGRRPVYATMVSSGNPKWPTAPGIYRIWLKLDETDMNGQMGDEQPYSVATVPWTMFFARDLAFHTAYWHDRFGEARSHGCVNVAPIDARWLWEWATPDVPAGWSTANGIFERPGSLVRIHNAAAPEPEYRGYAKLVHEARLARMPPPVAAAQPASLPALQPTPGPASQPVSLPTLQPASLPTLQPASLPTLQPASLPALQPTPGPAPQPTAAPAQPAAALTSQPSSPPPKGPAPAPPAIPSSAGTAPAFRTTTLPASGPGAVTP